MKKEKYEKREDVEEEDIYTEEGVEEHFDDDMISSAEEGFMIGYLCAG